MLIENAVATVQLVATGRLVPMQDRQPPPGQLPEWGNAAPVGLAIVLVLLLATALLIRNMSKRIKGLPESFGPDEREADELETGERETGSPETGNPERTDTDNGADSRSS